MEKTNPKLGGVFSMIRVDLGEERDGPQERAGRRHGRWHWTCPEYGVEGYSRKPLLDACREIKRADETAIRRQIGLYRLGKAKPDLFCTVEVGAGLTVDEAGTPRFHKWKPRPMGEWHKEGSESD